MYIRDEAWIKDHQELLIKVARNKYNITLDKFEVDELMDKMIQQGLTIEQALTHFTKIHQHVREILPENESPGKVTVNVSLTFRNGKFSDRAHLEYG
jgi:hypothetical protein